MAVESTGGSFLSAFIEVLLEKLASHNLRDFSREHKFIDRFLKEWYIVLQTIYGVLDDAEYKQTIDERLKNWVNELKDAVYDAEDLLDEIATEALRCKLEAESQTRIKKVRDFFTAARDQFKKEVRSEVKSITARLVELAGKKIIFKLRESLSRENVLSKRNPKRALIEESGVYGRDDDKEKIVKLLLSGGDDIDVITILGMRGVGKTTLAQFVYDDDRVDKHFNLKVWIYASEEFDVLEITKVLFEAVTSSACDIRDLHLLQIMLQESLKRKKFLLVLDDIWNVDRHDWDLLRKPLTAGSKGSKVIVTSCNERVASIMGAAHPYHLEVLSEDQCWSIFVKHALYDPKEHPELEEFGKEIVQRYKGIPLAAKMLGALLCSETNVEEWMKLLRSDVWDLGDKGSHLIPLLTLIYRYLPGHLKRCFAYCSIFPRGYEFEKEELVCLWMAEDLVQQPKMDERMEIEEVGDEYIHDLLLRSFFQQSTHNKLRFVMHDLVNDFAQFVSRGFCARLDDYSSSHNISETTRHLSYSEGNSDALEKLKAIYDLKCVRTFLTLKMPLDFESCQLTDRAVRNLLLTQPRLSVLSLSHCYITELPASIGKLKYLRYLDVSHTEIKGIPEPVSTLYNLQTLMSSNCRSLTTLPKNMGKLVNLRHLNIGGTALEDMPTQMGRLTSLRMLSDFIVGKHSGSRMYELGGLLNLRGTLRILNLQNVVDAANAMASNLKTKKLLDSLVLEWSRDSGQHYPENESQVFEILQPHTNLKRLTIRYYGGRRFPNWLGERSFSYMVFLHLNECKRCMSLPSLGLLPSLKDLKIEGISEVEVVGPKFYGSKMTPFRSLETLIFVGMENWVEWISFEPEREDFPRLQVLCIRRCPNLRKALPHYLPSLTRLEITECQKLEASLPRTPVIRELQLHRNNKAPFRIDDEITNEAASKSFSHKTEIPNITHEAASKSSLPVTETSELQSPSDQVTPQQPDVQVMTTLKKEESLQSSDISQLKELPKTQVIPELQSHDDEASSKSSLRKMEIPNVTHESTSEFPSYGATSLSPGEPTTTSHSQDKFEDSSSFESLKISDISELKDFPPRLHSLRIEEFDTLESLPEEMADSNCCLEDLYIISCSSLKSLPRGGLPSTLKTLYIRNCRKLDLFLPENTDHQYTLLERLCIGSSCDSLKDFPLGFFPNLRSLCLLGFLNFESISIAEGLHKNFNSLDSLEIRDCPKLISFPKGGLPATNLTSIWISNCSNLKSLPERMHTLLPSLQVLSISNCPILELFPEEGLPSNLYFLCITSCNKLTPRVEWGMQTMASLGRFEIEGECSSVESFPEEGLLPDSLPSLCISRFSNLKHLDYDGLQCLTSLETLEISCCKKLQSFPVEGLPTSLSSLIIKDCPLLKVRCRGDEGVDWPRIAHIPYIEIDEEVIS